MLLKGSESYPAILASAIYCLLDLSTPAPPTLLADCLAQGAVPVLLATSLLHHTLPFAPLLDWASLSLTMRPTTAATALLPHLRSLPSTTLASLQQKGAKAYTSYLSSPGALALATLNLLELRLVPTAGVPVPGPNLLSLPLSPPKSQGFTALILTYNRVESLFQVLAAPGTTLNLLIYCR